jgi:hypothetical protein
MFFRKHILSNSDEDSWDRGDLVVVVVVGVVVVDVNVVVVGTWGIWVVEF